MFASSTTAVKWDLWVARLLCSVLRSLEACHCTCAPSRTGTRLPGHATARPHIGISRVGPIDSCGMVSTRQGLLASIDVERLPSACAPRSAREVMSGNLRESAESIASDCKGCQCVFVGPGHLCTDVSVSTLCRPCSVTKASLSSASSAPT